MDVGLLGLYVDLLVCNLLFKRLNRSQQLLENLFGRRHGDRESKGRDGWIEGYNDNGSIEINCKEWAKLFGTRIGREQGLGRNEE